MSMQLDLLLRDFGMVLFSMQAYDYHWGVCYTIIGKNLINHVTKITCSPTTFGGNAQLLNDVHVVSLAFILEARYSRIPVTLVTNIATCNFICNCV